jgi:hypothetical protein
MPQLLRNIDQNWRIVDGGDIHWRAEEDWQAGEPLQVGVGQRTQFHMARGLRNCRRLSRPDRWPRPLASRTAANTAALHRRSGGAWQRTRRHRSLSRQKRIQCD